MAPRAGEIVVAALIGLAAAGVGFVVNARAWQLRRVGEHGRCPSVSWLRHSQQAMRVTDLIANETRAVARLRWRFIEPDQGNVTSARRSKLSAFSVVKQLSTGVPKHVLPSCIALRLRNS